ncbi:MAG: substrate-binding domain-containing protein [Chitinophagaceae bacterium]
MIKKISLKDIALHVGVSTALVSYVLNGKEKEARVGPAIAKKIKKAALDLNYQPNFIARSLKSGKTNTIGFIVADISNPFFSNLARIVEDEAKKLGYTVIFGSSDEQADKSASLISTFKNRQVDGLIIAPAENTQNQIKILQNQNFPFVLIDRFFPSVKANSIRTNNYGAAFEATSHLIKSGYKKIAMLAYETSLYHMQERIQGYKAALKENKITFKNNWLCKVKHNTLEKDVASSISMLMQHKEVDSFLFATNTLAVEGLKQINKKGLKVPDDVGIVAFDEPDAFDLFYSPVTYIKQNIYEIGKQAVKLLLLNKDQGIKPITEVVVETKLIIRRSSKRKGN